MIEAQDLVRFDFKLTPLKMKNYLTILALSMLTFGAVAQTEADKDANEISRIEERVEKLKTDLDLSDAQVVKLREAMTIQQEDLKEQKAIIRKAEKEMKDINRTYHESLQAFLSEEQIEMLKDMKPSAEEREAKANEKDGKGKK